MKRVSNKTLFNVLLGTGLYLLDPLRDRLVERIEGLGDRAKDAYDTHSGRAKDAYETGARRVRKASDVLQGEDDSHIWGTVGALLVGLGVGVGVGILIAPASGEETRNNLSEKVQDLGGKVWSHGQEEKAAAANY
jgi:YtxH-like protein